MRVGYALCGSDASGSAAGSTVNAVAQAGALAALGYEEHWRSIVERTRIERERLEAVVEQTRLRVLSECRQLPVLEDAEAGLPRSVAEVEKRGS
ncbi:MAG: hypothetical protein ACMVO3_00065 [Thalassobaculum sp.]